MKKIHCLLFACMLFCPDVKSADIASFYISDQNSDTYFDERYAYNLSRAEFQSPLVEGNYYTITIIEGTTDTLYCRRAYYNCTIADCDPGSALYDTGTLTADGIIGFYNIACDIHYDTDETGEECPPGWDGDWTDEDYVYANRVKGFHFKFSDLTASEFTVVISDDH